MAVSCVGALKIIVEIKVELVTATWRGALMANLIPQGRDTSANYARRRQKAISLLIFMCSAC